MGASNIERFDQLVGEIFASLYDSFPVAKKLEAEKFVRPILGSKTPESIDLNRTVELEVFFDSSMTWLRQSGYIYFEGEQSNPKAFYQCVLTAKTLAVLKAEPKNLTGTSLGSELKKATKDGVSVAIKSLTSEALEVGARFAYTSVMSWAST